MNLAADRRAVKVGGGGIRVGAGLSLGAALAAPAAAQADDFRVTNLNDDGSGSLRRALENANDNPDADRVLFKSKLSGRIELASDLEVYRGDVEILGPGARRIALEGGDERVLELTDSLGPIGVTVAGLTLTGGNAGEGAGLIAYGDIDLVVSRATITGNAGAIRGGGISSEYGTYFAGENRLVVEGSTISNNSAYAGGGIFARAADTISIRNSTVSGNSVTEVGGGVLAGGSPPPTTEIVNSTITENQASLYGGGLHSQGFVGQTTLLRGSVVANNRAPNAADVSSEGNDPFTAAFSLIGDTSGATVVNQGGNLLGVDPNLKPLANNGGPTDTHAFKKSPVKNKIPKSQSEKKDQRGAKRKGKGDIGAYELTKCKGVIVNRVGTGKKDRLKGTKKADGILGLGGNDKLSGKKGRDGLCGGRGKDKLKGGPGKDKLDGGPGKDKEIQ